MPYDTGNPDVDAMINRDAESWKKSLQEAGGNLYGEDDLEGLIRQVSYKQNAGRNPADFIAEARAKYDERRAPTSDRPYDSQGPMYDQRTNQLSAAGRAALQASPQTLGQLVGLAGGDPRFNHAIPQAQWGIPVKASGMVGADMGPGGVLGIGRHDVGGAPAATLGSLALPVSRKVTAPDWSYLTRGR